MKAVDSRSRTPNFNSNEERALLALVNKYKHIIECKKTDAEANNQKKTIWVELAQEFNAQCVNVPRSEDVLRNKYRNLKKRSKQKFAYERCYVRGTGGGPTKVTEISDIDSQIKEIIGKQITGLHSEFDDDSTIMGKIVVESEKSDSAFGSTSNLPDPEETKETSENASEECSGQELLTGEPGPSAKQPQPFKRYADWSSFTPEKLKSPRTEALIPKIGSARKNKITNKVSQWNDTKVETTTFQKQIILEQHNLQMQLMREKHAQGLEFAEEEHDLKMQLLREQLQERK